MFNFLVSGKSNSLSERLNCHENASHNEKSTVTSLTGSASELLGMSWSFLSTQHQPSMLCLPFLSVAFEWSNDQTGSYCFPINWDSKMCKSVCFYSSIIPKIFGNDILKNACKIKFKHSIIFANMIYYRRKGILKTTFQHFFQPFHILPKLTYNREPIATRLPS